MTISPPTAAKVPISADCVAAVEFDWPEAHKRCRGNGALYLPGTPNRGAPVLPQIPCGCTCHRKESS